MERYLTDKNSAHPNYVKTSGQQIIYLYAEQSSMFQISAQDEYSHFHYRLLYSYIKKYINIYKSKYH